MPAFVSIGSLEVAPALYEFIEGELLPSIQMNSSKFWGRLTELIEEVTPRNVQLLDVRIRLQKQLDEWHSTHRGQSIDLGEYEGFLRSIGYVIEEPADFTIENGEVDYEIADSAGPQLVVPLRNARFTLNAVNARWGSLYDALYGSDVIDSGDGSERGTTYNPLRGQRVIDYGRSFLDAHAPLKAGSHSDVAAYKICDGALSVELASGQSTTLRDGAQLRGYTGSAAAPSSILLANHGLHIELMIDRLTTVGASDPAGVADIILEAALTTILDLEDSVAAVDAEDKVEAYRNWLGINRGDLSAKVNKDGTSFVRSLARDRTYTTPEGGLATLSGHSLLYVRNVGLHMKTDAVRHRALGPVFEGILDAVVTTATATVGLDQSSGHALNRTGSVYIVKPKLHGPAEVAFTMDLFDKVEDLLRLPRHTIKLGLMDEERRLSANLKAAIYEARHRIVFINTGFLDRSGDEIHSCKAAGPVVRKSDMRDQPWIVAYEQRNVAIGLAAGLAGKAQIGKGMWTMPDKMADMLAHKGAQLVAGASTAWVPSPIAAVLHTIHYHQVDVQAQQRRLSNVQPAPLAELLRIPVAPALELSQSEIQSELDANVQSVLGYVVRWVDQGIGCSKVPDLNDVGLMEDRATLRISSQLLANWLLHEVISLDDLDDSLSRVSQLVDKQNAADPNYVRLVELGRPSQAYAAARELIASGHEQPNGYTEVVLHKWRLRRKADS